MKNIWIFVVLLFLFQSCATAFRPTQFRTSYEMKKFDDLITSNLDYFLDFRYWNDPSKEKFNSKYLLIVENTSTQVSYQFDFDKVALTNKELRAPIECRFLYGKDSVVAPGNSKKIHCEMNEVLGEKVDANWKLEIPYTANGKSGAISYLFRVKKEDY